MRENPDKLRERSIASAAVIFVVRCEGDTAKGVHHDGDEGIALLDEVFAEEEIRGGWLRQLLDLTVPNGAYWLVTVILIACRLPRRILPNG
ncbi:hypothetical protein FHX08_004538 [Rhizobium sp. BK529]|uniref:hypothetical protein n=1 Tax=unclassified Rhizobium TaxID=2613769 RepID=UPI0010EA29A7|nr:MULTISPECIES: hypothetical protein [unclassified Rhizobium]MBB3594135.1 hypothetical protein [Rhizobium sp. BK529]TCS01590.1 hypothetical protein EV281_106335 [Rhizobium sp. BK418]